MSGPQTPANNFAAAQNAAPRTPAQIWGALDQTEKYILFDLAQGVTSENIRKRKNLKKQDYSRILQRLQEKLGFSFKGMDEYKPSRELLAFICAVPLGTE